MGTRWTVFPAMGLGFAVLTVLFQLVSTGALAVNFTTTDKTFQIYSNYIQGRYGAGFLDQNKAASSSGSTGVAEVAFKTAKLAGLCAISHQDLPGIGDVTMMITAGVPVRPAFDNTHLITTDGADQPIQVDSDGLLTGQSDTDSIRVSDLFLNSDALSGYANNIQGLDLGRNAPEVGPQAGVTWPTDNGGSEPTDGNFGLYANYLNVSGLDGGSYGVNLAGQVGLPHLKIAITPGTKTQADCPTQGAS